MESYLAPFWQSGTRTQTQTMSLSLLQCWSIVYRLPETQQQLFEGGRVLGRVNPFLFTPVRPTHCCLHTARFPKATGVVDWFSLNPIFKDWTFSLFVLIQSWRQFIEICSKLIVAICCLSHVCQSPFRLSVAIYSNLFPLFTHKKPLLPVAISLCNLAQCTLCLLTRMMELGRVLTSCIICVLKYEPFQSKLLSRTNST